MKKNFLILRILDRFKFIFEKFNIDYPVLRKILQIKFLMDTRRGPTNTVNTSREKKDKNYFKISLFVYAFMGSFLFIPLVIALNNMYVLMSITFSVLIFLIGSNVIAEFSSVLLDTRDKTIILTKPVEGKTLTVAKFIHILNYLTSITLSLTITLIISLFIKLVLLESFVFALLFIFVFLIELILLNLFIIVLTTLLYIFILKYFSGEKLKDIINYVQIILVMTISIGYQLFARIFEFSDILNVDFHVRWYHSFIPPFWFSAPFEVLFYKQYGINYLVMFFLLIFVPIVSFIVYLKLIPKFEDSLLKLNEGDNKKVKRHRLQLLKFLFKKDEYPFYKFCSIYMKRERDFKLRVYPLLGFSLIFPFLFIFQNSSNLSSEINLLFIYFSGLMIPNIVMLINHSTNYKAAWIFISAPIKDYNLFVKASLKTFIIRLLLPIFLIVSSIFIYLMGVEIIVDLVVVFLVFLLYVAISAKIRGNELPMSQSFENLNKGQGMLVFITIFILIFFGAIHSAIKFLEFSIYPYGLILFILNIIIWKLFFRKKQKLTT